MSTTIGSGQSVASDTRTAAVEAIRQALQPLGPRKASFGWLFAARRHDLGVLLSVARELAPGCEFIAASSGGGFTERGFVDGVVAMVIATDAMSWSSAFGSGLKAGAAPVAKALAGDFDKARMSAMEHGFPYSNTVLVLDGLTGTGEALVDELLRHTRMTHQVIGGAAADEWEMRSTAVGSGERFGGDAAAALHVFAESPWGVGVQHGRCPATGKMTVTRANGSTVYEIDHKPAIEAYRSFAASQGRQGDDASLLVGHELGIYFLGEVRKARAALGVGKDGSVNCAASVPEGSTVCILGGEQGDLVTAAKNAAQEAKDGLRKARASGVVVFNCVSRLSMLGKDGFGREIEAIRSVFPGVPIAGFHTYGEIARYKGRMDGWHNTTAVVCAIPE